MYKLPGDGTRYRVLSARPLKRLNWCCIPVSLKERAQHPAVYELGQRQAGYQGRALGSS